MSILILDHNRVVGVSVSNPVVPIPSIKIFVVEKMSPELLPFNHSISSIYKVF